jgi:hypothetical protein
MDAITAELHSGNATKGGLKNGPEKDREDIPEDLGDVVVSTKKPVSTLRAVSLTIFTVVITHCPSNRSFSKQGTIQF